ncbi:MAG TPA: zinc ABC transporter substrate-binding protein [Spirochaetota bacterium]|nr:zinc ABC transporter substrate-binding protein [Spirochaetota bacterium]
MKKIMTVFAVAVLSAVISFCGKGDPGQTDSKPVVAVSILPQKYFLERIAGDRVTVLVLAGEGQNPHSYEPTPGQMTSLAGAKGWILSGVDFEISLKEKVAAAYPLIRLIDGTKGVKFRHLEGHHHEEGHEHADKDHDHEDGIDKHIWLGKEPVKIMAGHIRDFLVQIDPDGKPLYEKNYMDFANEIDTMFADLKKNLAPYAGKKVFVFHPAFGYFLDEFGIEQEAVETGGKEPSAKNLTNLITMAKKEKPVAIFVQAQFPVNAAKTIADSAGAEVVTLDPLSSDWPGNIKKMGTAIENSLKKKTTGNK